MKIDLGFVALLPWTNIYNLFTNNIENFNGNGGYKIFENKCYICCSGTCTGNILKLPVPKSAISLNYIKNNKVITVDNFNGEINVVSGDIIQISTVYSI